MRRLHLQAMRQNPQMRRPSRLKMLLPLRPQVKSQPMGQHLLLQLQPLQHPPTDLNSHFAISRAQCPAFCVLGWVFSVKACSLPHFLLDYQQREPVEI